MAAKVALTQRSFARESVGFALGVGDWITSKSEKVSEISALSDAVSNVTGQSRSLFRRLQQLKLICMKLKLVDMECSLNYLKQNVQGQWLRNTNGKRGVRAPVPIDLRSIRAKWKTN